MIRCYEEILGGQNLHLKIVYKYILARERLGNKKFIYVNLF